MLSCQYRGTLLTRNRPAPRSTISPYAYAALGSYGEAVSYARYPCSPPFVWEDVSVGTTEETFPGPG